MWGSVFKAISQGQVISFSNITIYFEWCRFDAAPGLNSYPVPPGCLSNAHVTELSRQLGWLWEKLYRLWKLKITNGNQSQKSHTEYKHELGLGFSLTPCHTRVGAWSLKGVSIACWQVTPVMSHLSPGKIIHSQSRYVKKDHFNLSIDHSIALLMISNSNLLIQSVHHFYDRILKRTSIGIKSNFATYMDITTT